MREFNQNDDSITNRSFLNFARLLVSASGTHFSPMNNSDNSEQLYDVISASSAPLRRCTCVMVTGTVRLVIGAIPPSASSAARTDYVL